MSEIFHDQSPQKKFLEFIALDKAFFQPKSIYIFLFLDKNICCGYSLEAPWRGASNEYHNICFCREIRKLFT